MVHQRSLCYKNLIQRHFVVSSTNVRRARVIKWKNVCIVLCCWVQYVEINTEQKAFVDSINFLFSFEKTAAESHRLLREAYGRHVPSQDKSGRWFRRFKSGDFDARQEGRQGMWKSVKKFEDVHFQALLDEDNSQTQKQLPDQLGVSQQAVSDRPLEMQKIQKTGRCVPHELNDRAMEKRKNMWHFARSYKRKSYLHCTRDEKWINFENSKRQKSWVDLGAPSTSTPTPNRFGRKTMLFVWWDQNHVVYYELLKPEETVNTKRYQQQLTHLNRLLLEKKPRIPKEETQSHFSSWQSSITYDKTGSLHVGSTQLGSSIPCGLLTRLSSLR